MPKIKSTKSKKLAIAEREGPEEAGSANIADRHQPVSFDAFRMYLGDIKP